MDKNDGCGVWVYIGLVLAALAGWVNHLFICFTEREWGFLIGGAIFFPIAVIHGWGRWFGWW